MRRFSKQPVSPDEDLFILSETGLLKEDFNAQRPYDLQASLSEFESPNIASLISPAVVLIVRSDSLCSLASFTCLIMRVKIQKRCNICKQKRG